jgi:hypothetical protein
MPLRIPFPHIYITGKRIILAYAISYCGRKIKISEVTFKGVPVRVLLL